MTSSVVRAANGLEHNDPIRNLNQSNRAWTAGSDDQKYMIRQDKVNHELRSPPNLLKFISKRETLIYKTLENKLSTRHQENNPGNESYRFRVKAKISDSKEGQKSK